MFLFAGYFDESSDEDSTAECYTVAGYIGPPHSALTIDLRWKDVLSRFSLEYYKASEIASGWGQFKQHRESLEGPLTDADRKLQREIKSDFLDVICEDDGMRGISASILIQDWHTFHNQEPLLSKKLPSDMYTLCSQLMLMEAGLTQYDHNVQSSARLTGVMRPIFDSHYEYEPIFRAAFPAYVAKNPKSSRYLLPPVYESEKEYRCLQAADLLCSEVRRSVAAHFREPGYELRIPMKRLLERQAKMYVLSYEVLKSLSENQSPDNPGIKPIYNRTERPARAHKP
jgi:hypothetical protein